MEFSNLTFILTEECNFDCSYCFQKRGKTRLDILSIEKALDFFQPHLSEEAYLNFTGGEPLLVFDAVDHAVRYAQAISRGSEKNISYSITTNGSLIDDNILDFFEHNEFTIMMSFDGLAQDIARKKRSYEQLIPIIEKILERPSIKLEVNSVFTPGTIGYLSKSIQALIGFGIPNITFALDKISYWDSRSLSLLKKELESLRQFTLSIFRKTGKILLSDYWKRYKNEIFSCDAGKNRMALAPDGKLWGCHLFCDLFRGKDGSLEYAEYCFGDLDTFQKVHERIYKGIMSNYANLRMDHFHTNETFCRDCPDLEECWACPVDAAFSSTAIGAIPAWTCEITKIFRKTKELFWRDFIRPGI
jgi:radical SAM protein with 4Fe4S-binding SPASM domain